jgi:outer membrane protein OmpA-like peptidoglycan-associated protein
MKHFASLLLAGTMISGTVAFGAFASTESAPFVLAQAEVPPPPPGAEGAPAEGDQKRKREERQQPREDRQQQRQEKQQQRQEQQQQRQDQQQQRQQQRQDQQQPQRDDRQQQRQEQQQQRQEHQQQRQDQRQKQIEERQQRQEERRQPTEKAPPPVEKQAPPPVEKHAPPPVEKQTTPPPPAGTQTPPPAAAPTPPPSESPADRKQQRREERQQQRQMEKDSGPTPPVPPVPPRTQAPAGPDSATPPAPPVPPAAGKQAPPPGSAETAPAAPSVAPAPPPAGEQPAIPPEEFKQRGQRTPEQRERATERAERDFKQRDQALDRRFDRRVEEQGDRTIIREGDDRVIIRDGDRTIIRSDETERLRRNARDVREERRGNQSVTVIQRPNGVEIVTIRDDDGNLIRRVRRDRGREVVLIDNERAWERGGRWDRDRGWRDRDRGAHFEFFLDLPPVVVDIPREEYIVDADDASYDDFEEVFDAPPLIESERPYSLQEVTQNVRLRERVRSIDLNSINFPLGEWTVPDDQIGKLENLARAMKAVIDRDPTEVYLIEGHTDAVGSQVDNLSLSDRRAEEVAAILTEHYEIPAENLVTQGYGEDYLKVNTLAANQENRRVTIRNITPLLNVQQSQAAPQ